MHISDTPKHPFFLFQGEHSFYAMNVDERGVLRHIGWGPTAAPEDLTTLNHELSPPGLFALEANFQEVYGFGEITSALPSIHLSLDPDCGLPLDAETEAPNYPVRDLQFRYASHRILQNTMPAGAPAHGRATRKPRPQTLEIVLKDAVVDIELSLFYRSYEDCDIIERWCELRNHTPGNLDVDRISFASWSLPIGDYRIHTPTGQIFGEFQMQRVELPRGLTLTTRSGNLTTSHRANPALVCENIADPHHCFFAALAYSGNWRIDIESLDAGCTRIHGGEDDLDTRFTLRPGESHRTHAFFAGCSDQGRAGAAQCLHRLQRDYLQIDSGERPVLYNSWEATEFNLSVQQQITLADRAAGMGVELFVVDDGWFGGRRHDRAGLGDWQVSPDVFPEGLMPLIDHVHGLGMKFGIWFEPEMVNPDSNLYRAHPEWVLHYPGRERTPQRNQLILDFGRPEVVDYIETQLTTFLDAHPVDFIKWDMNRLAHPAGSVAGRAIWRKHVAGVYRIMDTLRKRYPNLSLQSCSAGGGRVDLGMAQRVEQFWTSDNTDAFHRIRAQDTFGHFYSPNAMECWVTESPNHQTKRPATLETRFAVAMRGVLGIGSNLSKMDEAELDAYAQLIAFYKQVRPLVQQGTRHVVAEAQTHQNCSAWWFVNASGSEGFLSAALVEQKPGHIVPRVRLPGLQRDQVYHITLPDGSELPPRSGAELADHGIFAANNPSSVLGPHPGAARMLHVKKEAKEGTSDT